MHSFQEQLSVDARNYVAGHLSDSVTGSASKGTRKQKSVSPNHSGTKEGTKDEISLVGVESQMESAGAGARVHDETPRSQSEDQNIELSRQI